MAERNSGRATSHRLEVSSPEQVRNVVLVGPSQSGKTSLAEALLLASGAVTRAGTIAEHNTVCDFEDGERAHGRSSSLAIAPVVHAGCKINLIDTPGYADFVGEVRAGLRAADCALFVVAANESVDENTRQLWRECEAVNMPRAVVVTKLDHARADFDGTLRGVREAFGERVLPVVVPSGDGVTGLLGGSVDDDRRGTLIEAVIEESEDESLMDRYLGGDPVDEDLLVKDLETAVAGARLHPVLAVCAHRRPRVCRASGSVRPRFSVSGRAPGPGVVQPERCRRGHRDLRPGRTAGRRGGAHEQRPVRRTGQHRAGVLRDPGPRRVGARLRPLLGVLRRRLRPRGPRRGRADRRAGAPVRRRTRCRPRAWSPATSPRSAGSAARRPATRLSSPEKPRVLKPWTMPTALLPVAIEASSRSDEDKLSTALGRLRAEDPSLRIEQNPETGQVVLWVMGEAHADQALDRLRSRYGVAVDARDVIVPLRETFTSPAKGHGRHVKQSGGHGQYAICDIEIEPLPQGGGFEFVDKVVGGAVPRQFISSVEKGVRAQMERGVTKGYPVVDLRVTLTDGKAHSVDSSDAAFQSAGALALREAADAAELALLEPYDEVEVLIPSEHVGSVMSDLSARRGRLLGTEEGSDERTLVRAHVPQTELVRYAIDLRATTHGAGTFTRTFAHYEPMPEDLGKKVEQRG